MPLQPVQTLPSFWRRTLPNVGTLLDCQADILQLDVTDVVHKGGGQEGEEEVPPRLRV